MWIDKKNTLRFEVEIKAGNCQWLSSTGQSRAQPVPSLAHTDSPLGVKEKVIKKGVQTHWGKKGLWDTLQSFCEFPEKICKMKSPSGIFIEGLPYIRCSQGLRTMVWCGTCHSWYIWNHLGIFVRDSWPHTQKFQVYKFEMGSWGLNFNTMWFDSDELKKQRPSPLRTAKEISEWLESFRSYCFQTVEEFSVQRLY